MIDNKVFIKPMSHDSLLNKTDVVVKYFLLRSGFPFTSHAVAAVVVGVVVVAVVVVATVAAVAAVAAVPAVAAVVVVVGVMRNFCASFVVREVPTNRH